MASIKFSIKSILLKEKIESSNMKLTKALISTVNPKILKYASNGERVACVKTMEQCYGLMMILPCFD